MSNLPADSDPRVDHESRDEIKDTLRTVKRYLGILIVATLGFAVLTVYLDRHQANEIQDQRRTTLITACAEQNARHDATILKYDTSIQAAIDAGLIKGERLQRARESRQFTVGLINALAPVRNCEARARRFVK